MFYELYADRNVVNGGLWFDPEENEIIEVIDMDSGAGETGVNYIERGSLHVTEERMRSAVESSGHFSVESPPGPPKSRKRWFSVPWTPPPAPGYLFWVPKPPIGPKILEAWDTWTEHEREGGKFEELPEEIQELVFQGAQALHGYAGMDRGETHVVIQQYPGAKKKKEEDYPNAIISRNPEAAIWRILKEMGVRKNA